MPSVLTPPLDPGLAEHTLAWAEEEYTEAAFYRYGSRRVVLTTASMKVVLEVGNPPLEPLLPSGNHPIINGFLLTPCHGRLPSLSLCPTCHHDYGKEARTSLFFLRAVDSDEGIFWATVRENWEASMALAGMDPLEASLEVSSICRIIENLHRLGITP